MNDNAFDCLPTGLPALWKKLLCKFIRKNLDVETMDV